MTRGGLGGHETNVLVHGTHTHSGPGGFSWYTLYEITSYGFSNENYQAVVTGIAQSVLAAEKSLKKASVSHVRGQLSGYSANRSLYAYLFNPKAERDLFNATTDPTFEVLKVEDAGTGQPLGLNYFFAVHGTSMNNTNRLVSGDNRGYASQVIEKSFGPGFVASSGQANEGDNSPNTVGQLCMPDLVTPCRFNDSTCFDPKLNSWRSELCRGVGPGTDMFEAAKTIGAAQADKALELWSQQGSPVFGPVDFRHTYIEMANITIEGTGNTTCPPAMGYSFAAGTTDGPGNFNFRQGSNSTNPFWNVVVGLLKPPSPAQVQCQAPKPVLLDVGEINPPWAPRTLPIQILRLGRVFILAPPSEFSTMAGRRLRSVAEGIIASAGVQDAVVLIAGLANAYSGYTVTEEEYTAQRYEGASTMYGPHQLAAYTQEFSRILSAMLAGQPVDPGTLDKTPNTLSFLTPVVVDGHPIGKPFGTVLAAPAASYPPGSAVEVTFVCSNPRNDLRTGGTFLNVEAQQPDGTWAVVAVDADWETRFTWTPHSIDQSDCTVRWEIPASAAATQHRIVMFGAAKVNPLSSKITQYQGVSPTFYVAPSAVLVDEGKEASESEKGSVGGGGGDERPEPKDSQDSNNRDRDITGKGHDQSSFGFSVGLLGAFAAVLTITVLVAAVAKASRRSQPAPIV